MKIDDATSSDSDDGEPNGDAPDPNADRRRMSADAQRAVVTIALVTAAASTFVDVAPTGTRWWDLMLTMMLGVLVVAASVRSAWLPVAGAAAVAAMLVGFTPWLAIAAMGFVTALITRVRSQGRAELRALSGALTFLSLLHLSSLGTFGLSALVAGLAMGAILFSAFRRSAAPERSRIARVVIGIGAAAMIVTLVGGLMALSVRSIANEGVRAAREGLDLARAGKTQELGAQLDLAADRFDHANSRMSSPLLAPLALVPIAAQHHRSLSTATEQGLAVAREAAAAADEADLEQLQLRQGQFDLELLASMAPRLESAAQSLEDTVRLVQATRTGWLLSPVDDQLQSLIEEAIDVLPEARLAADAARLMPGMLGADGERRYLMLFGSPAESREFGGFIGGYALLAVDNGGFDLLEAGSVNDLVPLAREGELDDPDSYPMLFQQMEPAFWPQNLTATPNIGLLAAAVQDVFPQLAGAPIDGVIYADPYALAAMTTFTGPVQVDGYDEPLNEAELISFMFEDQYRLYEGRDERFTAIGDLAAATAAAFEDADLPGPERLGEVLGPVARAGRLQVVTYDDAENAFLSSVRLQRVFGAPNAIDSFALLQTNGAQSKLDLYLHRGVHYDVTVSPDGGLQATVEVELRSEIPPDAPALTFGFTNGTNEVLLSLYSEHELTNLLVNGEPHRYETFREFGFFRYALFEVPVAVNGDAQIVFELAGQAPEGDYRLAVWEQPLVNLDTVQVTYTAGDAEAIIEQVTLEENWLFDPSRPQ